MHGAELLRLGFSIDQVVHEYGDVCQSITELAVEQNTPISTDQFRTLNRCLDNAIADAVASFGQRQLMANSRPENGQRRLDIFADEFRRLVEVAIQTFTAVRTDNDGVTGATGSLLLHALTDLRYLAQSGLYRRFV